VQRFDAGPAYPVEPAYTAGDYPATGSPASDTYVAPGPYERTYVTGAPTDAGTYEPRPVDPVDPYDPASGRAEPPLR
jgi:hypothetical protein